MKNIAIIVGAGEGRRMEDKNKTFLIVNEKPLLVYSLQVLEKSDLIDEIILVVIEDKIEDAKKLVDECESKKVQKIVSGGKTRQNSVYNGLREIKDADVVLVHDAARPLITKNIIEDCINGATEFGAAIPVIAINDTIKRGGEFVKETIDRNNLFLIQTPQTFEYKLLKEAHESAEISGFHGTDDASLVERLGYRIKMISGSPKNIKITVPEDIIVAENLLRTEQQRR